MLFTEIAIIVLLVIIADRLKETNDKIERFQKLIETIENENRQFYNEQIDREERER